MSEAGEGSTSRQCEVAERQKPDSGAPDDSICRICLSEQTDSCQAQPCSHIFCFVCLLEWSKVKRRCPLCKEKLKSIIHNVRPDGDYDVYYPPKSEAAKTDDKLATTSKVGQTDEDSDELDTEIDFDVNFASFFKEEEEPRPSCSYAIDEETYAYDNLWSS